MPKQIILDHGFDLNFDEVESLFQTCFPDEPIKEIIFLNNIEKGNFIFVFANNDNDKDQNSISEAIGYMFYANFGSYTTLYHICVLPKYRGKKIAQKMMRKFLKIMEERNITVIGLYVDALNLSAIYLYQKFGFQTKSKEYVFQIEWSRFSKILQEDNTPNNIILQPVEDSDRNIILRMYPDQEYRINAIFQSSKYHNLKILNSNSMITGLLVIDTNLKVIDMLHLKQPEKVKNVLMTLYKQYSMPNKTHLNIIDEEITKYLEDLAGLDIIYNLVYMTLLL